MRLTPTYIAATLSLCATSNLALGQSIEPQLEAPEPDITTFDAGESYTTTSDTKNDIDIRILDEGVLVNGVGYTMYNNTSIDVVGINGKFDNHGVINNGGELFSDGEVNNSGEFNNEGALRIGNFYYDYVSGGDWASTMKGSLINDGTLNNNGGLYSNHTLTNRGTLNNNGTTLIHKVTNIGILNNDGVIGSSDGRISNEVGAILNNNNQMNLGAWLEGNSSGIINKGTLNNHGTIYHFTWGNTVSVGETANYGTINNHGTHHFDNEARLGVLGGTVNNYGTYQMDAYRDKGEITVYADGTVNNYDTINGNIRVYGKYASKLVEISNNGFVYEKLESSLVEGTVNNYGTINGNIDLNAGAVAGPPYKGTLLGYGILMNNGKVNGNIDLGRESILTGSGTINGTVSLEGTINPGNSPGTIITGSQTWFDGASYGWEINDSNGTAGGAVGWDLIDITATEIENGSLDLSNLTTGGFGIDIISLDALNDLGIAEGFDDPNGEYEFVILTTVGGITGFDAENFAINDDGFQNSGTWDWSIEQDGNNLVLSATGYTLVPEPTSTALLALGGLALVARRKRS